MVEESPLQRLRRQVKHKDGDTRGIARAFMEVWDKDGSGSLSRTEFLHGLRAYGVLVGDMTEAEKKQLWASFDSSGDGSVDLHEFLMVLGDVYAYRMQLINEAFNKLDQDGSGEISVYELKGNTELMKFFDNPQNPDGLISRMEFASYCSAISSICESDDQFREMLEELTDVESPALPSWRYFTTKDAKQLVEWVNKQYANPFYIMGGLSKDGYHMWARPGRRSMIKGAFSYEPYIDDGFQPLPNKKFIAEQGAAVLVDVDPQGHAHFLKIKSRPKRGTRLWFGKQRRITTTSLGEVETFLNELEPMPHNVLGAVKGNEITVFVNDMGASGYKYTARKSEAIPFEAVNRNECLVLGFTDNGACVYLDVPPVDSQLVSKRNKIKKEPTRTERLRNVIRNDKFDKISIEGAYESEESLRELFDKIDVDNSGFITNAELSKLYSMIENYGVDGSGRELARNIMNSKNMLDDDAISFEEFCVLMYKIAQW